MSTIIPRCQARRSSQIQAPSQSSIYQFGRITKANALSSPSTKLQTSSNSDNGTVRTNFAESHETFRTAKRKHQESNDICESSSEEPGRCVKIAKSELKQDGEDTICTTPKKSRSNPQNLPTPNSTPTKPNVPRDLQRTPTRGQQRLKNIKALVASAQNAHNVTQVSETPDSSSKREAHALQSRSSSLYERLKAKGVERAKAPAPPSAEALARRNALQRLPDVVRVLALPPAKRNLARASYSIKAMTERIQQSARSPMGATEIERCLRLLANEATCVDAVGFVTISKMGTTEAVTVDAGCRPLAIEKRIAELVKDAS